jgi:hypothetical protein
MLLLAAIAATAIIPLTAGPASAVIGPGNSGCKANDPSPGFHPGAEIGWYPAWAGDQSGFRAACVFDSATATSVVSSKFTIHDSRFVTYHNGGARTVVTTVAAGPTVNCIDIADSTGIGAWVNHTISGGTFSTVVGSTMLVARSFATSVNATACAGGGGISLTLNQNTGGVVIPVGTALRIDNSDSRSTICATTAGGVAAFTDPCANFVGPWSAPPVAAETGDVSGSNVPDYATFTATGPGTATLSIVATNVVAHGGEAITYKGANLTSTTRTINDATCVGGAPSVVTSAAGFFNANDVGLPFYGFGAGAGTGYYITATTAGPPSTATVTKVGGAALPACPVGAPTAVTVGDPSVTAPLDDQGALEQNVQLDLKPSFVAGSNDCALDEAEGFGIVGKWRNPGPGPAPNGFFTGAFAVQPPNSKAIGQIIFTTSVVSFAAYVVEREPTSPATVPADPSIVGGVAQHHFDVVFPNVPTTLALCASATSPGLGFSIGINATTVSQSAAATGVGKPGTAQLRNTNAKTTAAGFNSTAYVYDDNNPRLWVPASRFNRLCVLGADPPAVNFVCGDG